MAEFKLLSRARAELPRGELVVNAHLLRSFVRRARGVANERRCGGVPVPVPEIFAV